MGSFLSFMHTAKKEKKLDKERLTKRNSRQTLNQKGISEAKILEEKSILEQS